MRKYILITMMLLFYCGEMYGVTIEDLSKEYSIIRLLIESLPSLFIVLSPILLMIVLIYIIRIVLENQFVKKYGIPKNR